MRRRDFLCATGLMSLSACSYSGFCSGKSSKSEKKTRKPNILWITCEDMSANLGCYGDAYSHTPNIDKLAKESVRYTKVFATAPVCSPVRSCLISGVYASSLGTLNLRSHFPIPSHMKGFPSYFKKDGYFCSNNVKTDYNTSSEKEIIKSSWHMNSKRAHWRNRNPGQPFFCIFNDMVSHQSRSMVWSYERFQKEVQLRLTPSERHDPAKASIPPYYPDTPVVRKTVARYYDCITVMDKNTGTLLKQLEEDGLAEDTIVFFYSDHGAGMPRHKRVLLDSGMHVPLLIRFPKKYRHLAPAAPGETVDRLISFIDFPPTALSLADFPIPKYMQGKPFLGAAAKNTTERKYIFGARDRVDEAYDLARSVRDKNYLYIRNFMPHLSYNQPSFYSDQGEIRQEITNIANEGNLKNKAQRHYAGPDRALEELYDTANDPYQIHNLAKSPAHKSIIKKMRRLLRNWMIQSHDLGLLPEIESAERSKGTTPYEMARDKNIYPLKKILAAAELVGRGTEAVPKQIKLLRDCDDAAVRYWAAVGLKAHGANTAQITKALDSALSDSSPNVRITAAEALCNLNQMGKALDLLAKELEGEDLRAALRAARALELLRDKARPKLHVMKRVLQKVRAGKGDKNMFIRFALDGAVRTLD